MRLMSWRTRGRTCQTCGAVAEGGIFCRMCGTRLEDVAAPAGEGEPRFLRSARALLPGLIVATFVALLVFLFVSGRWVVGAVVLVVAALAAVALELLQKSADEPRSPVTEVRDRARFALTFVQIQSSARRQVAAIDAELHRLQARRRQHLLALGEAAYGGDNDATAQAREELRALDGEIEQLHDTRRRVVEAANAYIERERGFVEPTEIVPPTPDEPEEAEREPAEPARKGSA
jgi:ElaB/YqjD/DUF883 family membrane-anchored ribosome-binding protein